VRGIVFNRRNAPNEEEKVKEFVQKNGLEIVADIPRSDDIIKYEDMGRTVVEGDAQLDVSKRFLALAQLLIDEDKDDE
jgi:nitrogenase iron protein NifH